jgi:hypothetical protein
MGPGKSEDRQASIVCMDVCMYVCMVSAATVYTIWEMLKYLQNIAKAMKMWKKI